jgi:Peptidase A4 family
MRNRLPVRSTHFGLPTPLFASKRRAFKWVVAVASCLALVNINAFGQTGPDARPAANRIATNLAGVTTSIAPPRGFDALQASDRDLANYGFPPRPDVNAHPTAYARWSKALTASKTRVVPRLERTNVYHGPMRAGAQLTESTGTSSNWSGVVVFSGATSYNTSTTFYYVYADYVVPVAGQAFGACTGGWDYSASWVGIDGYGSNDVLQAGLEADAYCGGFSLETNYSAWIEWAPASEMSISNFPVAPGDDLFVDVWHTSPTQGYAWFTNLTTNQYVDMGFTAPSGTLLIGNSAEWVVERPSLGTGSGSGSLATLTNYVADAFWDCQASTENQVSYTPGSSGSLLVTMLDNDDNPISYPTLLGSTAILFQDEGSATGMTVPH